MYYLKTKKKVYMDFGGRYDYLKDLGSTGRYDLLKAIFDETVARIDLSKDNTQINEENDEP